MYDIKWIREHPDAFDRGLHRRGLEPLSQELIALDEKRRRAITSLEQAQARRKKASDEFRRAKQENNEQKAQALTTEVAELKRSIGELEGEVVALQRELQFGKRDGIGSGLATIPNMPLDDVPYGRSADDNVERRRYGEKPKFSFEPKQHFDLGESLGQMDFELAAKLSGARFVVLRKGLARLERALCQFFLDVHTSEKHGYTEINPPLLVRDDVMFGTAQLPKFKDDQFPTKIEEMLPPDEFYVTGSNTPGQLSVHFKGARQQELERRFEGKAFLHTPTLHQDGTISGVTPIVESTLWLIPTAEVPLTNLVRESIVEESQLPMRLTACTPCFRAEAGAAGKDTRGMIRQHQFTKVELVSITTPDKSKDEHERMLACAEEVLKKLDLHYRVVTLCTGDMGFAAQKTYDIEVWLPGQNAYREISSCSNCGEFQARRMNARYRPRATAEAGIARAGKAQAGVGPTFVHTLNGSGVAVGRALIAVMETYQQDNGSIAVPSALAPYMGGLKTIERT
jgi:seryl-tRNA synthetase